MKKLCIRCIAGVLIAAMVGLPLAGCSSSDDDPPVAQDVNQFFYDDLAAQRYTDDSDAQPPDDLAFVGTKHFDLTQLEGSSTFSASALGADAPVYALYMPAGVRTPMQSEGVFTAGTYDVGIPGLKPHDTLPAACQGLTDDALEACLDEADTQGEVLAPAPAHGSHFDAKALAAMFGAVFPESVRNKAFDAVLTHLDEQTRSQIITGLTGYIQSAPSHAELDLMDYDIFNPAGYAVSGVTTTDSSRGYINGGDTLAQHTTLMIQLSKTLSYTRGAQSELDGTIQDYVSEMPAERFVVNLQVYVHLQNLAPLRLTVPLPPDGATAEELAAYDDSAYRAEAVNNAFDANVLKQIVASAAVLPWESTEYTVSFQASPETLTGSLLPILATATEHGDEAGFNTVAEHVNAQTAILTGAGTVAAGAVGSKAAVKMFFQVFSGSRSL